MPGPARNTFLNVTHSLRRSIRFDAPGASSGLEFAFQLPAGSFHRSTTIQKVAAFNAGTTNTLTVGNPSSATAYADSTQAAPGTANVVTIVGTGRVANDTTVLVYFSQTGTAATAGEADIIIEYVPQGT